MEARAIELANYIVETKATVRQAANILTGMQALGTDITKAVVMPAVKYKRK